MLTDMYAGQEAAILSALEWLQIDPDSLDTEVTVKLRELDEEFDQKHPDSSVGIGMAFRHKREQFCKRYAWAVPSQAAVELVAKYSPLVEIGAGKGYWAKLLQEAGADVLAFDRAPPSSSMSGAHANGHCDPGCFTKVRKGGPPQAAKHPGRTLLLCWPPYSGTMAADCLARYQGEHVIYVGEGEGGCCASGAFFRKLGRSFEQVEELAIPQWMGLHDYLTVYKRRS